MGKYITIGLLTAIVLIFLNAFANYFRKMYDVQNISRALITNDSLVTSPGSGKHILPANVQKALFIIDSISAPDYTVYGTYSQVQVEFYQRLQESAWPLRCDSNSRLVFGFPEELSKSPNINIIYNKDNFSAGVR